MKTTLFCGSSMRTMYHAWSIVSCILLCLQNMTAFHYESDKGNCVRYIHSSEYFITYWCVF